LKLKRLSLYQKESLVTTRDYHTARFLVKEKLRWFLLLQRPRCCYLEAPKVEAFLMAVPNIRTIEITEKLERETGKPVVTGTIATIWNCLRELGIKDCIEGYGRLLES